MKNTKPQHRRAFTASFACKRPPMLEFILATHTTMLAGKKLFYFIHKTFGAWVMFIAIFFVDFFQLA